MAPPPDLVVAPVPDRDSAPWWEALGRHELLLQSCEACSRLRWPARALCGACASADWTWVPAARSGTVATWNVTWRTADPRVPVPYVVVLVRLDDQDDLLLPGFYDGPANGDGLRLGLPVRAGFRDFPCVDGRPPAALLSWRAATEGEA
ncbi:zinc ribbon domain-containing protein [Streptomyces sp. NPDC046909]|uniref:Zn-ribbon domain-containing OB-fold protein n=1 Tax=Streptomyces sp. NPDC046909 TaxID=3155617 RepID=UPI0033EC0B0B